MKTDRIPKTYSFKRNVIEHSENNILIKSFSSWCDEQYEKEFMNIESIKEKIEKLHKQINMCKEDIKLLKK